MIDLVEEVIVDGDITLGQFLKTEGIIESGGQAKWFLQDFDVMINDERETRRGKKLNHRDSIVIPAVGSFLILHQGEE